MSFNEQLFSLIGCTETCTDRKISRRSLNDITRNLKPQEAINFVKENKLSFEDVLVTINHGCHNCLYNEYLEYTNKFFNGIFCLYTRDEIVKGIPDNIIRRDKFEQMYLETLNDKEMKSLIIGYPEFFKFAKEDLLRKYFPDGHRGLEKNTKLLPKNYLIYLQSKRNHDKNKLFVFKYPYSSSSHCITWNYDEAIKIFKEIGSKQYFEVSLFKYGAIF